MDSVSKKHDPGSTLKIGLPKYIRFAAIFLLVISVLVIGIGFYKNAGKAEFRMKGFPTTLSENVVASVNGYERRETEGDFVKYYIKADKATTFSDEHQELEGVMIEIFDANGQGSDKITSSKAIYIPAENKEFTAFFAGNVVIETKDSLKTITEQVKYDSQTKIANADESLTFERENIKGSANQAILDVGNKVLTLTGDVNFDVIGGVQDGGGSDRNTNIKAGTSVYDQAADTVRFGDTINIVSFESRSVGGRKIQLSSSDALVKLIGSEESTKDVATAELFKNVNIVVLDPENKPTNITGGYALYNKPEDRFEVKENAKIVTQNADRTTIITSENAVYSRTKGNVQLTGNSQVEQGNDLVKGNVIIADLYPSGSIKNALARDGAFLRQATAERTVEITGSELTATFGTAFIEKAASSGNAQALIIPSKPDEYNKVSMNAAKSINASFRGEGVLAGLVTDGRTTIVLNSPQRSSDSSDKKLTADVVRTQFGSDGKSLTSAEAVGNAELVATPHVVNERNYTTTVTSPRFDCDFYAGANNVKSCVSKPNSKAVRSPTQRSHGRSDQVLTANTFTSNFGQSSNDLETLIANGNSKFNEGDRNAVSESMEYNTISGLVKITGGEPTIWDSRARAKAGLIHWNTKEQTSTLNGNVATTFYSQRQTGGATPFVQSGKPVYITAANADLDHKSEVATYTGNARAWQENNYVRANSITLKQNAGEMLAQGDVQSSLYDTKGEGRKGSKAPVFAASQRMLYKRDARLIRYEDNVDIRQDSDRIIGQTANIFLDEQNELNKAEIEKNVVITQPGRKATGDYAQYNAAEDKFLLRGNPARIDDSKSGSSQGAEMTMYVRDNRIIGEGRTQQNSTGRIRSVYKIKNN